MGLLRDWAIGSAGGELLLQLGNGLELRLDGTMRVGKLLSMDR